MRREELTYDGKQLCFGSQVSGCLSEVKRIHLGSLEIVLRSESICRKVESRMSYFELGLACYLFPKMAEKVAIL